MYSRLVEELEIFLEEFNISVKACDIFEEELLRQAGITSQPKKSLFSPVSADSDAEMHFGFNYGLYGMPEEDRKKLFHFIQIKIDRDVQYLYVAKDNFHCFKVKVENISQYFLPIFKQTIQQAAVVSLSTYQTASLSIKYFQLKNLVKNLLSVVEQSQADYFSLVGVIQFIYGFRSCLNQLTAAANEVLKKAKEDKENFPIAAIKKVDNIHKQMENYLLSVTIDVEVKNIKESITALTRLLPIEESESPYYLLYVRASKNNSLNKFANNMAKAHAKMASISKQQLDSVMNSNAMVTDNNKQKTPTEIQAHIASFMYGNKQATQFGPNGKIIYPKKKHNNKDENNNNHHDAEALNETNKKELEKQELLEKNIYEYLRFTLHAKKQPASPEQLSKEQAFENFLENSNIKKFR